MLVKSAQPGEGGGARPPPFTLSTITGKAVVYALAKWADTYTPPFFSSTTIWLAVRQARVRISARHPMEVPPTEPAAVKIWRWASAIVYE